MEGGKIVRTIRAKSIKQANNIRLTASKGNLFLNSSDTVSLTGKKNGVKYSDKYIDRKDGVYFIDGFWGDSEGNKLEEAQTGDVVYFYITTQNIKSEEEIEFTLYDWDGKFNFDDKIDLMYYNEKNKYVRYYKEKVDNNGKVRIWLQLIELSSYINSDHGEDIELYFECRYKDEKTDLPLNTSDYLIVYEKEVKISVIIELPHSIIPWEDHKGLAGHAGILIDKNYYDYGPDLGDSIYNEYTYDYDFDGDGKKINHSVYMVYSSYMLAPGSPWWAQKIANKEKSNVSFIKENMVIDYIFRDEKETRIIGEVHRFDFYVKESEAKRIEGWWLNRYKHLKAYSIYPWKGDQAVTTIKNSLNSSITGYVPISIFTYTIQGLFDQLKNKVKSTSRKHKGQKAKHTKLRAESNRIHQLPFVAEEENY